jgi:hypothetical protein
LLLRVQVFCLIDTRAAHNDKKEARSFCLPKKKKRKEREIYFIFHFIAGEIETS